MKNVLSSLRAKTKQEKAAKPGATHNLPPATVQRIEDMRKAALDLIETYKRQVDAQFSRDVTMTVQGFVDTLGLPAGTPFDFDLATGVVTVKEKQEG